MMTGSRTASRLTMVSGLSLAAVFATVGLIFLIIPGKVLAAFNHLAGGLGWPASTTEAHTLFLALAVAYMYVVTVLALQMARHPQMRAFSGLLAQAKAASSLVSLGLFVFQEQYLLYLANFAVDGAIALYGWWIGHRATASGVEER